VQIELLEQMSCPYCGGRFAVQRAVSRDDDRLSYGLIECRCFTFPVVDGIVLLSLAKGYGGAEEALQPYVPLQVAALHYLERDDVPGLRAWIRRHAPFAAELMDGTNENYLDFSSRVARQLRREVDVFLDEYGRYEVLGTPRSSVRRAARRVIAAFQDRVSSAEEPQLPTAADYYQARYFSPRVNAMALQFAAFPETGRILSLCCGHGVFENLLRVQGHPAEVVSLDGQFLNLLITRQFADHGGSYICHDVQFPLPFRSGTFDGVFSSTCLPEIPTQQTFAGEAIRVTTDRGWTDFDSIWNTDVGVSRVDPQRDYRFCQNFFGTLDDYVPMFQACAGPRRRLGIDVPNTPAAYVDGPGWAFGADIEAVLDGRADQEMSVVVLGPDFPGFVEPDRGWLRAGELAASLAFVTSRRGDQIELRRRPEFEILHPLFASSQFSGYPESATIELERVQDVDYLTALYAAGLVSLVPTAFTSDAQRRLPAAGATPIPPARPEREASDTPTPGANGGAHD